MKRFGIAATNAPGLTTPEIRRIARNIGRNQSLAEQLWKTGIHHARILASLVANPADISRATMDQWAADFDSWDVCDVCSYELFDALLLRSWPARRSTTKKLPTESSSPGYPSLSNTLLTSGISCAGR